MCFSSSLNWLFIDVFLYLLSSILSIEDVMVPNKGNTHLPFLYVNLSSASLPSIKIFAVSIILVVLFYWFKDSTTKK